MREHGRKRREAEVNARLIRYRAEYYERLFPWIIDYIGDDVPDTAVDLSGTAAEVTDDPVKRWVNDAEYQKLSSAERNQLALDRWRRTKRTRWQIGRDYERFIGYNFETLGYDVTFTGAIEGFQDMGRDVIAWRGPDLRIIQCKYWSQDKVIHEKHIFQLFGSALEYAFRLGSFDQLDQLSLFGGPIKTTGVKAVLYTSTKISDVAKDVVVVRPHDADDREAEGKRSVRRPVCTQRVPQAIARDDLRGWDAELEHQQRHRDREHTVAERVDALRALSLRAQFPNPSTSRRPSTWSRRPSRSCWATRA